jgi:hypothetical protein
MQVSAKGQPSNAATTRIADNIFEDSVSQIKSLRLTSRAWQSSPEKILFAVIYLGFNRGGFEG